jgi:hypothetical protein
MEPGSWGELDELKPPQSLQGRGIRVLYPESLPRSIKVEPSFGGQGGQTLLGGQGGQKS